MKGGRGWHQASAEQALSELLIISLIQYLINTINNKATLLHKMFFNILGVLHFLES